MFNYMKRMLFVEIKIFDGMIKKTTLKNSMNFT